MANTLYPVFLKLQNLRVLIVGGGNVALEKMTFMLKSSPDAIVTLVAPEIDEAVLDVISTTRADVNIKQEWFAADHLREIDIVLAATNDRDTNQRIWKLCKQYGKLINVADTPDLCDFYLGAIVTKGNLKVAISTNGQSPTFAKRFRQVLEQVLPDETDLLLNNLRVIRDNLRGTFEVKVKELNKVTEELVTNLQTHEHANDG